MYVYFLMLDLDGFIAAGSKERGRITTDAHLFCLKTYMKFIYLFIYFVWYLFRVFI